MGQNCTAENKMTISSLFLKEGQWIYPTTTARLYQYFDLRRPCSRHEGLPAPAVETEDNSLCPEAAHCAIAPHLAA